MNIHEGNLGSSGGTAESLAEAELPRLTDAEIDAIAEGMPGGLKGFMGGWGWRQFARAIEDRLPARRASEGDKQDAARYRWLRQWPTHTTDYITSGLPWVVHIVKEHGVPTMNATGSERLDAAIDSQIRR